MSYTEIAEKRGRSVIENMIRGKVENYEFTKGRYDHIDLFITGTSGTFAVEIKNRRPYTSEQIEKYGGQYIMKHKWDDLMEAHEKSGYTPHFIAIYKDVIAIWDLTTLKPLWKVKEFDLSNYQDDGKKIYEYSELMPSKANYKYKTEKYEQ